MTATQKRLRELRERQSKGRQRMAELAVVESLSDEQRAELDTIEKSTPDLERQIRAATVALETEEKEAETRAADNPDTEQRERIALRSKASLTNFLTSRLAGQQVSGAEAELRSAAGIADGIPLELWDVPRETEQRADAVTGTPSTVGVNLDRIRPQVFANSIAPMLGIEMPRVESGSYASATISASLTAAALDKGGEAMATAATFAVTSVKAKRISARLGIAVEDVANVGAANFESILRENLSLVLSDALDDQIINGDGVAPNLAGIFSRLADPDATSAVIDFDGFASVHADGIDGLWASGLKDVSITVGPATMSLSARTFQSAANYKGEMSAAAYAQKHTGGWMTNKRMPSPGAFETVDDVQQGILFRKGRSMMGGGGAMRTAVCAHWNSISIDDIFSGSASGERYFTMHVLLSDTILVQPDAYEQVAFQLS